MENRAGKVKKREKEKKERKWERTRNKNRALHSRYLDSLQ